MHICLLFTESYAKRRLFHEQEAEKEPFSLKNMNGLSHDDARTCALDDMNCLNGQEEHCSSLQDMNATRSRPYRKYHLTDMNGEDGR